MSLQGVTINIQQTLLKHGFVACAAGQIKLLNLDVLHAKQEKDMHKIIII